MCSGRCYLLIGHLVLIDTGNGKNTYRFINFRLIQEIWQVGISWFGQLWQDDIVAYAQRCTNGTACSDTSPKYVIECF